MWKPNVSFEVLQERAFYIQQIRRFFFSRNVTEVDVPVMGTHSVTDPHVSALFVRHQKQQFFLQTSPEYFMKRLLAAGAGDMYYMGKAFRDDDVARVHHPEFTILEWYRLGYDDRRLAKELTDLIAALSPKISITEMSYQEAFYNRLNVNPHSAEVDNLLGVVRKHINTDFTTRDRSTLLDLLFSFCVEPHLPMGLVVIFDYPECQSALAKTVESSEGFCVARRFEVFLDRVELANGYWELVDFEEQKKRFGDDNQRREQLEKDRIEPDPFFLEAIEHGLPPCAGVALGVDRLMMYLLGTDSIASQRPF